MCTVLFLALLLLKCSDAFIQIFALRFRLKRLRSIYDFIKTVLPGDVDWNFHKYLINREGIPVQSYAFNQLPMAILPDILKLL